MLRIALALVSGVALALSFEPVGLVVLLPLAVATFLWCVHGRSLRYGALLGLLFGLVYWYGLWPFHGFIFGGMLRNLASAMDGHAGAAAAHA